MEETFISTGPALEEGIFVERPNRFLIRCALKKAGDGAKCAPPRSLVEAHLPDPGRLKELLVPGRRIWLRSVNRTPRKQNDCRWTERRTEGFVSLDSQRAESPHRQALQEGVLEEFRGCRFFLQSQDGLPVDFLLAALMSPVLFGSEKRTRGNGLGLFTDAITARGPGTCRTG